MILFICGIRKTKTGKQPKMDLIDTKKRLVVIRGKG